MRVFVAVNQIEEIGHRQTTALLIAALVRNGCRVHLAGVTDFSFQGGVSEGRYIVHSAEMTVAKNRKTAFQSSDVESFAQSKPEKSGIDIHSDDLIFIRTNPGRDIDRTATHHSFVDFCVSVKSIGVRVVNDPANVRFFASKAALSMLAPQFRPPMIVSHDPVQIAGFVRQSRVECVVKPVTGSRGQDVVRLQPDQENLFDLVATTFHGRGIIAQHFVHSNEPGDCRVVIVGGKILEIERQLGGIRRKPASGDFRANLHAGGTAHKLVLTSEARSAVEHAARILDEHGIWLAGVDIIENQIIEFNVFSTGGLCFAEEATHIDFSGEIVRRLLNLET